MWFCPYLTFLFGPFYYDDPLLYGCTAKYPHTKDIRLMDGFISPTCPNPDSIGSHYLKGYILVTDCNDEGEGGLTRSRGTAML